MAERRLDGKRAIVTGGTRGLGLAIARELSEQGARVAITYSKSDADAKEAAERIGGDPLVFKGTVTDKAHADDVVAKCVAAWGGLDILVNNAGVTRILPIALLEEPDWDEVMDVNVKGVYLFSRAALKPMIRMKQGGHILNVGTFASERVIDAPVHFAAAKSAVRGFTEALAREVGRYGIFVNVLAPGLLDVGVGMLPQHRVQEYTTQAALGRIGTAEEIAKVAAFLVSPANTMMSGAKLTADGGV